MPVMQLSFFVLDNYQCLEEHLAKLEDALEATKEHMLKLQQERDQKQTEITSLGNEVKQLK